MAESSTELNCFLNSLVDSGQQDSEGRFTLSREQTLAKLAGFQLSFAGAWVLKIVQAVVASGSPELKVRSTSQTTTFTFQPREAWNLDQVEAALCQPELRPGRALGHLAVGLWAVGFGEGRDFELSLPGENRALRGGPGALRQVPQECSGELVRLVVWHLPESAPLKSTLKSQIARSWKNAEVIKAVAGWCYTCPISLEVDGRRMDSLQFCPEHGWGSTASPLALLLAEAELPELPISELTLALPPGSNARSFSVLEQEDFERLPLQGSASLPLLLSVHLRHADKGAIHTLTGPSHCFWVRDGVVVQKDPWPVPDGVCSLACFVSAEGIPSDLGTLALLDHPERCRRQKVAMQAVRLHVSRFGLESLERWYSKQQKGNRNLAAFGFTVGFFFLSIPSVSLPTFFTTGFVTALSAYNIKEVRNEVISGFESLKEEWEKLGDHHSTPSP